VWVDAPAVDLARHVHVVHLAPPAGTVHLVQVVEELWSRRLDLTCPPWEMWFLPGLTGGRVGVLLKVHHVVADGVGAMALLGALLDRDVTGQPPPSDRLPTAPPSTSALLRDQLRRLRPSGRAVAALAHPVALVRRTNRGWCALRRLDAVRRVPPTSLDRVVGPGRRLRRQRPPRPAPRRRARARCDGVNDVPLAAVAGGLPALLMSQGEDVHDLHPLAYEPVTLLLRRAATARPDEGGMIFVPLPLGIDDPIERLRRVAVAAADCKQHVIPAPAGGPNRSRLVRRLMMRFAARRRWADVYVANVPVPGCLCTWRRACPGAVPGRAPRGTDARRRRCVVLRRPRRHHGRRGPGRLPRHRDLHRRPARGAGRAELRRIDRHASPDRADRGRA
jgi:WS/DGAT/MGAT family acyltransferase